MMFLSALPDGPSPNKGFNLNINIPFFDTLIKKWSASYSIALLLWFSELVFLMVYTWISSKPLPDWILTVQFVWGLAFMTAFTIHALIKD